MKNCSLILSFFISFTLCTTNVLADTITISNVNVEQNNEIHIKEAGTYKLSSFDNFVKIIADVDDVVIDATGSGSIASLPNGAKFENLTFNFDNSSYHGFQHAGEITMDNCVLNGLLFSYGNMKFNNCSFNQNTGEYVMCLYAGDIDFDNCKFNVQGKVFNIYNEGNAIDKDDDGSIDPWVITAKDCEFNSSKINKSAFNVKETCGNKILKYDVTITNCTTNDNFPTDEIGNDKVWMVDDQIKGEEETGLKIVKDGVQVYPELPEPVASIDSKEYDSLNKAIEDIPSNNSETKTIKLLKDINQKELIVINKNNVVLDGNGYSVIADTNKTDWETYKTSKFGQENLISVSGKNITIKNITIDVADYRGISCMTTQGGDNVTYSNVKYKGRGSAHYYGYATGMVKFEKCDFDTHGYAIHFGAETKGYNVEINNSIVRGWSSFGGAKSINANNSEFYVADDTGKNGLLAKFRPYSAAKFTNCKFSTDYLKDADYCGFDTGSKTTVVFENCSLVNPDGTNNATGNVYSIIDYRDTDESSKNSLFIFDAKGNSDIGYYEGKFVTNKLDNIKVSKGCEAEEIDTVDGSFKVYEIQKKTEKGNSKVVITDTDYNIPEYYDEVNDLQSAVDIVKDVNDEKNNNGEKTNTSTIVVDNESGIEAVIDDSVIIVAKKNNDNKVEADPGYKLENPDVNDKDGTITYMASALQIGETANGGKGNGKTYSLKVDSLIKENDVQASSEVLTVADKVSDTQNNNQLKDIVSENIDNLLIKAHVNQGTAASALNKANIKVTSKGGDDSVPAKDINVFIKTYYETEIIEDKTMEGEKSYTIDITPVYQAYASTVSNVGDMITEGNNINSVKVGAVTKINTNKAISLKLKLPAGFVTNESEKVYIVHTLASGNTKTYETILSSDGSDFYVEFTNPDGFSYFEITKVYKNPKPVSEPNRRIIPNTSVN